MPSHPQAQKVEHQEVINSGIMRNASPWLWRDHYLMIGTPLTNGFDGLIELQRWHSHDRLEVLAGNKPRFNSRSGLSAQELDSRRLGCDLAIQDVYRRQVRDRSRPVAFRHDDGVHALVARLVDPGHPGPPVLLYECERCYAHQRTSKGSTLHKHPCSAFWKPIRFNLPT